MNSPADWPKEFEEKVREYAFEHGFAWLSLSDSGKREWADKYITALAAGKPGKIIEVPPSMMESAAKTIYGACQSPLEAQRQTLIAYARLKLDQQDWHGVRDACVDIEILDARIKECK